MAIMTKEELEITDKVFRYFMAEQAQRIKSSVWEGALDVAGEHIDALQETMRVYSVIKRELENREDLEEL
jgi:hypothetical protein